MMRLSLILFTIAVLAAAQRPVNTDGPASSPATSNDGRLQTLGSQQGPNAFNPYAAKVSTAPTPRTADGHPDLSGNWAPNAIRENVDLQTTGVEVPMLPWAAAVFKQRHDSMSKDDPEARCLPPGVPRMSTTPYPWTIVQTPKLIVILYEGGAHIWRKIFMDGRPHDPNVQETWLGDSIGRWEGDTLVVDTVGQNDKTWIDQAGIPHSNEMRVIERFRRMDTGHMEIEHTVEDPKTFTRPWKFTTHPTLLPGELIEYICQENNRDVEHLLGR
jgi:hypothetical protein